MKTIDVEAAIREERGKGSARSARRAGRIPAVLYGEAKDPVALTLDSRIMEKIISGGGEHSILSLKIAGTDSLAETALIKMVQRKTITSKPIHLDLLRISMDKTVEVNVPVHLVNTEGVKKLGGIIQQNIGEMAIECLPANIPEFIAVDMSALVIGDSLMVKDIAAPEGVTILDDGDEVIASVLAPVAEKVAEAAPVVEGAEAEAAAPALEGKEETKEKEKGGKEKGKEKGKERD